MFRLTTATLLALASVAPGPTLAQANPYSGDRTALRAGAALFANRCATCHAPDGRGGPSGPDLTGLWRSGADDREVFGLIRAGVPGSAMPNSTAPDNELWAVVAHVRSLGTFEEAGYGSGDAVRGERLFEDSCARCHSVGGVGGRLGPELTHVASSRPRDFIERSIRDPDAAVARGYRVVKLRLPEGSEVSGTLKGEDAFSVQIMDTRERLRGYLKASLEGWERVDGSLMPAFGPEELDERALSDLLSYLAAVGAR